MKQNWAVRNYTPLQYHYAIIMKLCIKKLQCFFLHSSASLRKKLHECNNHVFNRIRYIYTRIPRQNNVTKRILATKKKKERQKQKRNRNARENTGVERERERKEKNIRRVKRYIISQIYRNKRIWEKKEKKISLISFSFSFFFGLLLARTKRRKNLGSSSKSSALSRGLTILFLDNDFGCDFTGVAEQSEFWVVVVEVVVEVVEVVVA